MTGKSALFNRLQGAEFDPSYSSTPEIQVANIPWQYKESNDIIKIEIWDVVDKAHNKTPKADAGIKLEHQPTQMPGNKSTATVNPEEPLGLDASTVNVYRNTHGAIFLFDVCKQWTFDYVNDHLADVPENISILVLGNCSDKSDERVITLEQIHATLYQHNQDRIEKGAIKPNLIRYAETSMKTGLGLKYIYDYLAVPFLQLQVQESPLAGLGNRY
ncbi:P-loop containing nucleoside triphosphate hydrolase protein [Dichotomocladium elegans]|nr:P-loop containing nucleoside triphosphate hydrolase protein [Dichotomocladium elegans]